MRYLEVRWPLEFPTGVSPAALWLGDIWESVEWSTILKVFPLSTWSFICSIFYWSCAGNTLLIALAISSLFGQKSHNLGSSSPMCSYLPQSWGWRVLTKTQAGSVSGEELKIHEPNFLCPHVVGGLRKSRLRWWNSSPKSSTTPDTITSRAGNPTYESGEDTYAGNSTMLHWQNILVQRCLSFSFCKCRFPQSRTARNWDQLHFVCRQGLKENHLAKYLLFPFTIFFFCLKFEYIYIDCTLWVSLCLFICTYKIFWSYVSYVPSCPSSLLSALSLSN